MTVRAGPVRPGAKRRRTQSLLTTLRPDGRHVRPVLAVWLDGALYFSTGESTRKGRNLAANSHCVMTVVSLALPALDLVVEGEGAKVSDKAKLQRVAAVYASKYGWHVTVRDGAFDAEYGAPAASPLPYAVYEVTPTMVFGFTGVAGTHDKGQGKTA